MNDSSDLLAELPSAARLALAYAPAAARGRVQDLLLLDSRLAGIVRRTREPLLGQIQLAWWREQLQRDPADRPRGQPLLAALSAWRDGGCGLAGLVDGWEGLLGIEALEPDSIVGLVEARGAAWAALSEELTGSAVAAAAHAGWEWAMADLAAGLGEGPDRQTALALAQQQIWQPVSLPRGLRSLAILHGLARRSQGRRPLLDGPVALAAAVRIGIMGR